MDILFTILIWIILAGFLVSTYCTLRNGLVQIRRLHQIPCSHCVFFTGDYRLKCTVNPCKALSEAAIGCLDYEPVTGKPTSYGISATDWQSTDRDDGGLAAKHG